MPAKNIFRQIFIAFVLFAIAAVASPKVFAADPAVTLSPTSSTTFVGQTFDVTVDLAADSNTHSETTFTVAFDPAVLQLQSITQGSLYFNLNSSTIDNTGGTGTATLNFFGGSSSDSGTVATLSFTSIASGSGALSFSGTNTVLDGSSVAFTAPTFTGSTYTINAALTEATVSLSSDFSTWSQGDTQTVAVALDTQGNEVAGVDIQLTFDPAVLQVSNLNFTGLLPNQGGSTFDNSAGTLSISGIVNEGSPFNGQGTVATIDFTALAAGTSAIDFVWTSGSTTDTNVPSYAVVNTDLLTSDPAALSITVGSGGTLDFEFGLLDFIGDITTKTGTLTVVGPDAVSNWLSPSALGVVTAHPLGTFTYGIAYDVVITVPGYLKTKQNDTLIIGTNPNNWHHGFR